MSVFNFGECLPYRTNNIVTATQGWNGTSIWRSCSLLSLLPPSSLSHCQRVRPCAYPFGLCSTLSFLCILLFPCFNWFEFLRLFRASVFSQCCKSFSSALQNVFQHIFRLNLIRNAMIYFDLFSYTYILPLIMFIWAVSVLNLVSSCRSFYTK